MTTRIDGLDRLRARVLVRLPKALKEDLKAANEKSADEFMGLVRKVIPKGDPTNGNLVDTLRTIDEPGSETGVRVIIGGMGEQIHPMHLEGGHRAPDGSHVPGKPYWNPAKRVLAKRIKGRATRAANKAVKSITT